jgi:dephospho-CoA kinase
MPKKLILIVGLAGSGKSTVSKFIKKEFNADVFLSGDIIRDEVKRRGWEYTSENDAYICSWFHEDREKLLIKRLWDKARKSKKKIIVIDGFRNYENPKYLEEISKIKPIIISVTASSNVRIQRKVKRGSRFFKGESIKQMKLRDKSEKSLGLDKMMKNADYKINTTKLNKNQVYVRVRKMMKRILDKINLNI